MSILSFITNDPCGPVQDTYNQATTVYQIADAAGANYAADLQKAAQSANDALSVCSNPCYCSQDNNLYTKGRQIATGCGTMTGDQQQAACTAANPTSYTWIAVLALMGLGSAAVAYWVFKTLKSLPS